MLEVEEYSAGTIRVSDDTPPSADVGNTLSIRTAPLLRGVDEK